LRSVFFYISGHGFGHASRQIEVINAFGAAAPELDIHVRTSAPRWLFERTARVPLTFSSVECDTGVVQVDGLRLDERATIERAAAFYERLAERASLEADVLRRERARLVACDAPPLACEAAALAGIRSVVVANFTWDWIYEGYSEHVCGAPKLVPAIRQAYSQAAAALRLPMHGGFEAISTILDVPFIARHSRHASNELRTAFGLPLDRPLVLSSFGGLGIKDMELARLDCLDEFAVLVTAAEPSTEVPDGVHLIVESTLYDRGFRYEDLVQAADVVVSKPGYGIISECIAHNTAILYTSRGRFAEYDVLVREMPRYLRCRYIDQQALFDGRWRDALNALLAAPPPPETAPTDGADAVVRRMLELL
jgi:L-arabinokinase